MGLLFFIGLAQAATPVVVDGTASPQLLAEVSALTGLPAEQLVVQALDPLLQAPPQTLGDAIVRRCTGEATRGEQVLTELVRATAAWNGSQDEVATQDHLDLAVAHLGCLGELADPQVAAQVFLLRGALEARRGDPEVARNELRTALAFRPDLVWDSRLPLEGETVFAEVQQGGPAGRLEVVPSGLQSGPWVDGRLLPADGVEVGVGLHLAQHASAAGIRSSWLVVGGDARLVLPGSFRRPILEKVADPQARDSVEALLAATLPSFQAAYVAYGGGLWLVSQGPEGLDCLELRALPAPAAEETGGKRGKKH